jgi:hypothetical protein
VSFHSGTDDEDIIDNAAFFPYYLSVVVNNRLDWDVKIGVLGKEKIEKTPSKETILYSMNDDNSELKNKMPIVRKSEPVVTERDVVFMFKGSIVLEEELRPSDAFIERATEIATPKPTVSYPNYTGYQYNGKKDVPQEEKKTKRDVSQIITPNEAFAVISEALGLGWGVQPDEVVKYFDTIEATQLLSSMKDIEEAFDKKYLISTAKYEYYEYVECFLIKLKARTYMGGANLGALINYFEDIYETNKPADENTIEKACLALSRGVWKTPPLFNSFLGRMYPATQRTQYLDEIRKKFPTKDGNTILELFKVIPNFNTDWVTTGLQNEMSWEEEQTYFTHHTD